MVDGEVVAECAPRFGARVACRFVAVDIERLQHQQGARQRGPAEAGEFACHPILSLCSMAGLCHPARPAASDNRRTAGHSPLVRRKKAVKAKPRWRPFPLPLPSTPCCRPTLRPARLPPSLSHPLAIIGLIGISSFRESAC